MRIHPSSYCETRPLSNVIQIPPFIEQRDIDNARVTPIVQQFESYFDTHGTLFLDTPIVLLECRDHDAIYH